MADSKMSLDDVNILRCLHALHCLGMDITTESFKSKSHGEDLRQKIKSIREIIDVSVQRPAIIRKEIVEVIMGANKAYGSLIDILVDAHDMGNELVDMSLKKRQKAVHALIRGTQALDYDYLDASEMLVRDEEIDFSPTPFDPEQMAEMMRAKTKEIEGETHKKVPKKAKD